MRLIQRVGGRRSKGGHRAVWALTPEAVEHARFTHQHFGTSEDEVLRDEVEWWGTGDFEETQEYLNEAQVQEYVQQLREGKPVRPLLADDTGRLYDGNHRLAAAKRLGLAEVPVLVADYAP